MKLKLTVMSILLVLLSFSCREEADKPADPQAQSDSQVRPQQPMQSHPPIGASTAMQTGVVQEVIQATSYTYLKVKENDREFWIAVGKQEMKTGETISFAPGIEMDNFESKDLQRTFDTLYLVDSISVGGQPTTGHASTPMSQRMKPVLEQKEVSIEPAEGGITIGELLADTGSYAGKTVRIKGQVTKVNPAIMGKNWVHLQDGTSASDKFDLTVTTQHHVDVGEVVTFEGKIAVNKDFGAGYVYEVIMEEAVLQTQ